jgi:hypothetical protein
MVCNPTPIDLSVAIVPRGSSNKAAQGYCAYSTTVGMGALSTHVNNKHTPLQQELSEFFKHRALKGKRALDELGNERS